MKLTFAHPSLKRIVERVARTGKRRVVKLRWVSIGELEEIADCLDQLLRCIISPRDSDTVTVVVEPSECTDNTCVCSSVNGEYDYTTITRWIVVRRGDRCVRLTFEG